MSSVLELVRSWPVWIRASASIASALIALAIQLPIENEVPGEPFLLFYIVVIASALAFGGRIGLLSVVLTTLLTPLFFEPLGSIAIHHAIDLVKIELYAVISGVSVIGVSSLRNLLLAAAATKKEFDQKETRRTIQLRELVHRVGNNFAIVSALIQTKAVGVNDPEARCTLDEAADQVAIMARVHRRLQSEQSTATLDSELFVTELCSDLQMSLARGRPITIKCNVESFPLTMSQSIPLGLIVNELATNALKHAFPGGRTGTVRVSLSMASNDHLRLCVEDDGVGRSPGSKQGSVGEHLVDALACQLGGKLVSNASGPGMTSQMIFPYARVVAESAREASHALA